MNERRPRLHPILMLATGVALICIVGGYLALLRTAALDRSRPDSGFTSDERDVVYLSVHGIALVLALVSGIVLGGLGRRSMMTWALAFGVTILVVMVVTMIGSYELACEADMNDLVRHWTCER
ncbi:MAG: hypothetical protein AB7T37_06710 [Dehalococcoidia bacterium]